MNQTDIYYQEIIKQLMLSYDEVFEEAGPGHCMKLTGIPDKYLSSLRKTLLSKYPRFDIYIIREEESEETISATKLIELRNNNENPLLAILPSNSRTPAEDSYGNATFQNLNLSMLDKELAIRLSNELSKEISTEVNEILSFLKIKIKSGNNGLINFLLSLREEKEVENIGNYLVHLNLLPDSSLHRDDSQVKARLNYNRISVGILSDFSKAIYDRIRDLPMEKKTLQGQLINFFKEHPEANEQTSVVNIINSDYPNLNFGNWKIPVIDTTKVKILVEFLKDGANKVIQNTKAGDNEEGVLKINPNSSAKLKIKFSTNPAPNQIDKLESFRVMLIMAEDDSEHSELIRWKNPAIRSIARTKSFSVHSNSVDDGSYYLRVDALDKDNNILNREDEFKDIKAQEDWEKLTEEEKIEKKESFNFKKTSETDNFIIEIDDIDEPVETRKAKLHNALEAYYRFRLEDLKNSAALTIPELNIEESSWVESKQKKLFSTYILKYSNRHHYQIILSKKLKDVQLAFLKNPKSIGCLKAELSPDPNKEGFLSSSLKESILQEFSTDVFLSKREQLFNLILGEGNDVFESFELANHVGIVTEYLNSYYELISSIKNSLKGITGENIESTDEFSKLTKALLSLDIAYIKTKLPNNQKIEAAFLSPIHPLRLFWSLIQLETYTEWENKTLAYSGHLKEWKAGLDEIFLDSWAPSLNPLTLTSAASDFNFLYAGDISFGWAMYAQIDSSSIESNLNPAQILSYYRNLLNIDKSQFTDADQTKNLIVKSIKNYIKQHPYVEKLVINIINGGEAYSFADALVELEKDEKLSSISYEIRLLEGNEKLVQYGKGLKELLNPNYNQSEEAEAFSQASANSLFPKLRYSINTISNILDNQNRFIAHVTFLLQPFPLTISLSKTSNLAKSDFANGLILNKESELSEKGGEYTWNHFYASQKQDFTNSTSERALDTFNALQNIAGFTLAKRYTNSLPSANLKLSKSDSALLAVLHEKSDWVVTIDKHIGPEIYDFKSKNEGTPFLLDYIPGNEIGGISSFLTTHPTSEITGLIGPHFSEMGLGQKNNQSEEKIVNLLEDIRGVSSSLLLQLNQSGNQAFEVIGIALSKRVLQKKGILNQQIIIPIDLHKELFVSKDEEKSASRADLLIASIDIDNRVINFTILEVKCRSNLNAQTKGELITKMISQIDNTELVLREHFDPELAISEDRLDRKIKNYQLRSIVLFYLERSKRFELIDDIHFDLYKSFLNDLDKGYSIKFKKLGYIFNYSADVKHRKEIFHDNYTFFTFGKELIPEIMNDATDLDTFRLEKSVKVDEVKSYFGEEKELSDELKELRNQILKKPKIEQEPIIPNAEPEEVNNEEIAISNEPILSTQNDTPDIQTTLEVVPDKMDANEENELKVENSEKQSRPDYSLLIGANNPSEQYGLIGTTMQNRKIAVDLNETATISLFGVQGGGKSYSIGSMVEMVLKPFSNVNYLNSPMAGVIFHYSESPDYEPEFTSMKFENDSDRELQLLKEIYGATPDKIDDVVLLSPVDKIEQRKEEFPNIEIHPIAFNSQELDVKAWMFLLGAMNNDSTYIRQLRSIMKRRRTDLSIAAIRNEVENSEQLTNTQRSLAEQRLDFAEDYIDDEFSVGSLLKPGRLIIVDLRDEFIDKDEALGLFVIMLNIFSAVKNYDGNRFNKFIVFDEAHKYMDNKTLSGKIVESIREMRHKGVSIMIASQDPPSLPNEIIELSSIVITHKFNSPSWLKHIQKSITNLNSLTPADMASLGTGEAFLWASKATDRMVTQKPCKIKIRPRVTKHGGGTIKATDE